MKTISNVSYFDIVWELRLPRVLMSALVGIGLALCGTVMQSSVQNPLADPYLLGISSGAALGATFSILLGSTSYSIAVCAFICAAAASACVLFLASAGGNMSSVKLILSGTVINALCIAFSNFIIYMSNNAEGVRSIAFWTMGSLVGAGWDKLPLISFVTGCISLYFLTQSRILNTMLMGDEAAVTLGIQLNHYRRIYLIATALLTGVIVSHCGIIGFAGLIVPHIGRAMIGSDNRRLIPFSILFGAIFMIWTDVLARTIIPNSEMPIGIITALLGAPLFMYILLGSNYGFGGNR